MPTCPIGDAEKTKGLWFLWSFSNQTAGKTADGRMMHAPGLMDPEKMR